MKKTLIFFAVIGLMTMLAFTNPGKRYFEIARNLDIFASLFKEVNSFYVDEVNPNKLMRKGIDSMLKSLDPYTNYIPEDDIEDFRTQSTGQYGGIGALTTRINGKTVVTMVYEGYSAHKEGLKIGDEVIEVNGISIEGKSGEEINKIMKGQANSDIALSVRRHDHNSPINIKMKRERVTIKNVPYYGMADTNIGYVKLSEFRMNAGQEVRKAVEALKSDGATKIILDLRDNPGGLLIEAVNITNVFLPKGVEVVSTKGKVEVNNASYKTLNAPTDTSIPVVVMINSSSASASEIVAGVIQDYDRGVIVGQKSYGKGLVQVTRPLSFNAQLKVTTAKYYTPSGRCIQALDYSHRNADGSVGKIPDSLKIEFKTENGRTVYDGGGIDPDLLVDSHNYPVIARTLTRTGILFDYATKYYYDHPDTPTTPKEFELSSEEYQQFMNWVKSKNYTYTNNVEKTIDKLVKAAQNEKYYSRISDRIESLKQKVAENKEEDLILFKEDIKDLLRQDIISRYHLEEGLIQSGFVSDKQLQKAIEILKDMEAYNKILG